MRQPHFVMRDASFKAIVISVRGTATVRDLIADMAARPIPFAGGAAHTGMAAGVDGLLHYRVPASINLASGVAAAAKATALTPANLMTTTTAPSGKPPEAIAAGPDPNHVSGASKQQNPFAFSVPFVQAMSEQQAGVGEATTAEAASDAHGEARGFDSSRLYRPVEQVGLGGVAAIMQRAIAAFPDHRVIVTGHSLGAGIASLLTLKLYRIFLYMRRQQLEKLRGADSEDLTGYMHFLPPRPLNCWAYAPPACMSPELAALSCLSVSGLEDAMLGDEPYLAETVGPAAAARFLEMRHVTDPAIPPEWALVSDVVLPTAALSRLLNASPPPELADSRSRSNENHTHQFSTGACPWSRRSYFIMTW